MEREGRDNMLVKLFGGLFEGGKGVIGHARINYTIWFEHAQYKDILHLTHTQTHTHIQTRMC